MRLPRVLLDVDNVLADFDRAAVEALERLGGPRIDPSLSHRWDIMGAVPPEYQGRLWEVWQSEGYCLSIEPYPEAVEAVRRLREVSEVVFATGQMTGSPTWTWERYLWLDRHFGATYENIVITWAKHLIEGNVLVEDRPIFYEKWALHHPDQLAVLWAQPYNASITLPPNGIRTGSWDEVINLVRSIRALPD